MADDTKLRSLRSNAPEADSSRAADPLAELARLIGQDNLFDQMRRDATAVGSRAPRPPALQPLREAAAPSRPAAAPRDELRGSYDAFAGVPAEERYIPIEPTPVRTEAVAHEAPDYGTHYADPHGQGYATDDAHAAYADPYYGDGAHGGHELDGYGEQEYADAGDDAPPRRRRVALAAAAALVGVAAIGTAGVFGYRVLTAGGTGGQVPVIKADNSPAKVVPPSQGGDKDPGKAVYDRADKGQAERVVPREEQPVDIREGRVAAPKMMLPAAGAGVPAAGSSPLTTGSTGPVNSNEPKKVRTFAIRPDGTTTTDSAGSRPPATPGTRVANLGPTTSPRPVTTRPVTPGAPDASAARPPADVPSRTASLPTTAPNSPSVNAPAPPAGGHVVQLSSQKSEAEAQASFRSLQGKYPSVLSGRQPIIRRVDLGQRGTFYRAQIGPFASSEQANEVCSSLKAAGGQCVVQRN